MASWSSNIPAARKALARLTFIGLVLTLVLTGAFPALAQDTVYADPAGVFTAIVPATWMDESTAEYGVFTHSGVSIYLLSVDVSEIQAGIDSAIAIATPDLASGTPNVMGEFAAPSGTWTQIIYMLPAEAVGNVVAQSNGSATVVVIVTADSMAAMQAILTDANAILASISIEGVQVSASPADAEAPPSTPVPQAEGTVTFPTLTGPNAVGRVSYLWTDSSREEIFTSEVGDPRILTVWIWYPAAPTEDNQIASYLSDGMSALAQQMFGFGSSNVEIHAYDSAPILHSETGYPVLVFSHGNGMNSAFYASLLEEIVSHGYIVVGVDHTFNALLTTLADGQVIPQLGEAAPETDENFATRVADVRFVIDQLVAVNTSDAVLAGNLDLSRIGLIGHSFGGQTVAEACHLDERCRAVLVADVPLRGEVSEVGLSKPIMLMDAEILTGEQQVEEAEAVSGEPAPPGYEAFFDDMNARRRRIDDMLLNMSPDVYHVIIESTRHNSYTDLPLLATVQPTLQATLGLASMQAERGQHMISDYILAFFDTYLKGEPALLLNGVSADYPEVTFVRGQS
jgi:pimeloyl-ACP methyl ester carboxylesterase